MRALIIAVAIAALTCGCIQEGVDNRSCAYDSDCAKVSADCCGCTAGGKAAAINKNLADQWNAKLANECAHMACAAVISDDPSCSAEPKCVNYKCELR
ncbi:MAG: hypothetical protein QXU82_00150 [Candidatus Aenigmatarchaeota archaeon]